MKTIGLIGGISWESTKEYYRLLNEGVRKKFGELSSAKLILYSVNFAEIAALQRQKNWTQLEGVMIGCAESLARAGAEEIAICSNLMHRCAAAIEQAHILPLIHLADVIADSCKSNNWNRVALLGAKQTMEAEFYRERLLQKGLEEIILPDDAQRESIDSMIYHELCQGIFSDHSRETLENIISSLKERDLEAVILGCTELPVLLPQSVHLPVIDTIQVHCDAILTRV